MRLINTPRVVGYPTLEECAAAYPLFMVITRSLYVKEHGEGPSERNIPHYVRGYVFQKSKWYPCWGHPNDDAELVNGECVPISHEKYEQKWKEYVKQSNKEMEENHYGS